MKDLDPERLSARLHPATDAIERTQGVARAAVAILLRADPGGPSVLLLQRACVEGDPWSGQVALPGGREEDTDASLLDTARRETLEEVGRDLARCARVLGRLPTRPAVARGRLRPMTVTPYVFAETAREPEVLGEEAQAAFWLSLDRAASGSYDDTWRWNDGWRMRELPCWRLGRRVVWGMTHRMLSELLHL